MYAKAAGYRGGNRIPGLCHSTKEQVHHHLPQGCAPFRSYVAARAGALQRLGSWLGQPMIKLGSLGNGGGVQKANDVSAHPASRHFERPETVCLDAGDAGSCNSAVQTTKWLDTSGNGYDFIAARRRAVMLRNRPSTARLVALVIGILVIRRRRLFSL